jgi:hypothetical protein
MHFILGAKPGDHEFLFDQVIAAFEDDRVTTLSWKVAPYAPQRPALGPRRTCPVEDKNETFNTLKNQGYHYEHNYGHGKKHLSVVFAMLMMLAFLVDQTQQLCCPLFQAVWNKLGSKRALWDNLRSHFRHFTFQSMKHLYEVMLYDLAKELPAPILDTS